jgi:hypothetical protein
MARLPLREYGAAALRRRYGERCRKGEGQQGWRPNLGRMAGTWVAWGGGGPTVDESLRRLCLSSTTGTGECRVLDMGAAAPTQFLVSLYYPKLISDLPPLRK